VDKFLEMPLPQRLLIVGLALALIGGAFYYLVISSVTDEIVNQNKKYKGVANEIAQLKEYDSQEFKTRMEQERAEAERRRAAYARILPREEELPDLISSIKADADGAGLIVSKMEPVKQREEGEGYRGIPFNLEVTGSYYQFLSFLQAVAAPGKRLINIKDINISITSGQTMESVAGDVGLLRILKERERERGLTPSEKFVKSVLLFEEIARHVLLKADFVAMAYVYTGAAPSGSPTPAGR